MHVTLESCEKIYTFRVKKGDRVYDCKLYLNSNGKFVDQEIMTENGNLVSDKVENSIVDYIDKNWSKIVDPLDE